MTIDELVVELSLDPSKFTEKQKESLENFKKWQDEVNRGLGNLEQKAHGTTYAFGDMANAAEGLFTALAGTGMVAFARQASTAAADVGRMATNINVSIRDLHAFELMVERTGGTTEEAAGSLKSLADQMQRLRTGQASQEFLIGLSQVGVSDPNADPLEIFRKFAQFADTHNAQEVNQTGQRLGLSQGVINQALRGSTQSLKDFKEATDGALSDNQVAKLTRMQRAWNTLEQTLYSVGTAVTADFAGPFNAATEAISKFVANNRALANTLGDILAYLTALKGVSWILRLLVGRGAAAAAGPIGIAAGLAYANRPTPLNEGEAQNLGGGPAPDDTSPAAQAWRAAHGGGSGAFYSQDEKAAYIRATAAKLGINPETALAVAKSEGFNSFLGDNGTSGGAFQLHVTPGGRGHAVGDEFKAATGLDPLDPRNEREGIAFGLAWARQHGWGDFHGAARTGVGQWQGIDKTTEVNIGSIVLPGVKNAQQFANELPGALRGNSNLSRAVTANANSGQRQ